MIFQNQKLLSYIVCILGGGQDDGNPDKIQVAGMRIKRFKGWVGGKIKGIFSKKKTIIDATIPHDHSAKAGESL